MRELGQPSLIVDIDRAKDRALRHQCLRRRDGRARPPSAARPPRKSSRAKNSSTSSCAWSRNIAPAPQQIGNLLVPHAERPADSALRTRHHQGTERRILHLSRKQFALHRHSIFASTGRDLEGIVQAGQRAVAKSVSLPEGYRLDWGGEYSELLEAKSAALHHRPARDFPDLPDSLRALRQFQIPRHHRARRRPDRTRRRTDRAETPHTPFSVSSGLGLARLARCFRRNRRHSRQLHQ